MRRIATVIVLASIVVIGKFSHLVPFSWEQLRIMGEMSMILLIFSLVANPVTQFIQAPPSPLHFNKMIAVRTARASRNQVRIHLRSGEMREGYVVAHSLSRGTFILANSLKDTSRQRQYDAADIDEVEMLLKPGQVALPDETPSEA